ncbi:MAG: branched-subunit amino acid aminotransferase/4-amino-4-deoxychorismate lyase [Cognaticolwellia sp.]|jgi:branched-subunit amino acid aminotransferase/4-amino-4-deoxychorismate lyase
MGISEPDMASLRQRLLHAASHCAGRGVLRVQIGQGLEWIRVSPWNQERWARPLTLASVAPNDLDLELAQAKHCSRGHWERGAATRGVDELLWVDSDGQLLETHQGNVFAEVRGELLTPPLDGRILAGVTRGALLAAGEAAGIPVRVEAVKLGQAEALWVSSSLKGLAPVCLLDGRAWQQGRLGGGLLAALDSSLSS